VLRAGSRGFGSHRGAARRRARIPPREAHARARPPGVAAP